ncbi:MAG: hypothetical protein QMC85_05305 [Methanocellales archaeon]|nr:hypothetical protein [Methanocellales archaeon]
MALVEEEVKDIFALGVILIITPLIIFAVKTAMGMTMGTAAVVASHIGMIGILVCIYALVKPKK